jgi:MoaA/NifB/PqqE/SkfB family radical SAM enzyme
VETGSDVTACSNVWAKKGGTIVKNPLNPLCQELDSLPFRDFHSHGFKVAIDRGKMTQGDPLVDERLYLMLTSRGCAYNCSFCDVSAFRRLYKDTAGKFFRYRSVENCMAELEYAKGEFKKLRRIRFDDELFVPEIDWIEKLAKEYPKRIGLPFEILSDPRCLDEKAVKTLAAAGMDRVMIGIQATSAVNRRLYNRPHSDEKVVAIAQVFKRQKVRGVFQVIVDDPEVTRQEKQELLDLLLRLDRPYDLYMFSLCNWPFAKRTQDMLDKKLIAPEDVEGKSNKVLTQFMADFSFDRPTEDTFFMALNQLANKVLIPRGLVRFFAQSAWLEKHPAPVVWLAKISNLAKLAYLALGMLLKGEMSLNVLKRWIHILDSPST